MKRILVHGNDHLIAVVFFLLFIRGGGGGVDGDDFGSESSFSPRAVIIHFFSVGLSCDYSSG